MALAALAFVCGTLPVGRLTHHDQSRVHGVRSSAMDQMGLTVHWLAHKALHTGSNRQILLVVVHIKRTLIDLCDRRFIDLEINHNFCNVLFPFLTKWYWISFINIRLCFDNVHRELSQINQEQVWRQ